MAGQAFVVVKAIPYEQPELLAVWINHGDAKTHLAELNAAEDGRHYGGSPYAIWLVPFQVRTTDSQPVPGELRIVPVL